MNEADILKAICELSHATEHPRIRVGIGDDAAVWQPSRSHRSVISTDMLIENVHFLRTNVPAEAIGHKALAVNLSDLAAMGARPILATVALALPIPVEIEWVRQFYVGLAALARRTGVAIVGGDLTASPVMTISLTVVGEASPQRIGLRNGARPRDILAVTGPLGASRAGLEMAPTRAAADRWSAAAAEAYALHVRPEPRLREGHFLAASRSLHAMMDISDGLVIDVQRLLAASHCGAVIDNVPISRHALAVAQQCGADAEAWALGGGEDYELLVAVLPRAFPTIARGFEARFGRELIPIGVCTSDMALSIQRESGPEPLAVQGWDHFQHTHGMEH